MSQKQARRRYISTLIPSMAVYFFGTLGISAADKYQMLPPAALYGLAIIPILALLAWLWAQWRYITQLDEFLRMMEIKAVLVGVAATMAVASIWGTMEMLADAPNLPTIWVVVIFSVLYGLAQMVIARRDGASQQ